MKTNILKLTLFAFLLSVAHFSIAQDKKVKKSKKEFLVTISTEFGKIYLLLYDETPKHKANFIKLAQKGFYDSLLFHRVIDNFMIQEIGRAHV